MSERRYAIIAGDGICVEVTREALAVVRAACAVEEASPVLDELPYGAEQFLSTGVRLARWVRSTGSGRATPCSWARSAIRAFPTRGTRDIGGTLGTRAAGEADVRRLEGDRS